MVSSIAVWKCISCLIPWTKLDMYKTIFRFQMKL